jgi:hypothetical protein
LALNSVLIAVKALKVLPLIPFVALFKKVHELIAVPAFSFLCLSICVLSFITLINLQLTKGGLFAIFLGPTTSRGIAYGGTFEEESDWWFVWFALLTVRLFGLALFYAIIASTVVAIYKDAERNLVKLDPWRDIILQAYRNVKNWLWFLLEDPIKDRLPGLYYRWLAGSSKKGKMIVGHKPVSARDVYLSHRPSILAGSSERSTDESNMDTAPGADNADDVVKASDEIVKRLMGRMRDVGKEVASEMKVCEDILVNLGEVVKILNKRVKDLATQQASHVM